MATDSLPSYSNKKVNITEKYEEKKSLKKIIDKNYQLFFMTLPGILVIFVFSYIPMIGILIAFKESRFDTSFFESKWIGFTNFRFLFMDSDKLLNLIRNTVVWNVLFIVSGLIIALFIALLLNEISRKSIKIYQTIILFPQFISWVIASYLLLGLLDMDLGLINTIRKAFGFEGIMWYKEAGLWPVILIIANIWKHAGYNAIIYYTAIIAVDPEYYEAADLDGANWIQKTMYITLPSISNVIIIIILLQIGRICYADFGMFYQLTQDSTLLYSTTDVIDTYVYRALRKLGDIGMSSAAGLLQSVVGFLLVLLSNYAVKKINNEKSMF